MATTKRPLAVLNLPRNVPGVIHFARFVWTRMTDNAALPSPTVPLDTFDADIDGLETSEAAVLQRTKGNKEARDANYATVVQDLRHLCSYVQYVADVDPGNAEAIIESAGFYVKRIGSRSKGDLAATQGVVSGEAHVVAKAPARRAAYDWQYSIDGKTWLDAPSTLGGTTDIRGLTPGLRYAFRYRALTKAGVGDWSQVVWLLVK
jgi:hypothetical protein